MKTRGRPKKDNTKNCKIDARLTTGDMDKLRFLCSEMGLSPSDVIRKLLNIYYEIYVRKH